MELGMGMEKTNLETRTKEFTVEDMIHEEERTWEETGMEKG